MRRGVAIGALVVVGAALVALAWTALAPLPADSRELVYVFHQREAVQLACSFPRGTPFLIFVDPAPAAGWDRLRWRLGLAGL